MCGASLPFVLSMALVVCFHREADGSQREEVLERSFRCRGCGNQITPGDLV